MKKTYITLILLFFLFFTSKSISASSFFTYGEVKDYVIEANTKTDGSVNLKYNIKLDILGESVEQIDVKIPLGTARVISFENKYISHIDYGYKKLKIHLNRKYKVGENLNLLFSINIKDAYRYNEKTGIVIYRMNFSDVKYFKNNYITVKWKKSGVYFQGMGKEEGEYYVFKQKYSFFRNFQVMIQYSQNKFDILDKEKFRFENVIYSYGLIIIAISIIVFEIKNNVIFFNSSRYPLRGKNVMQ